MANKNTRPNQEQANIKQINNDFKNFTFLDSSKVFFFDVFFKLVISFFILYYISSVAQSHGLEYIDFVQQRGWLGFLITLISPLFLCLLFFIYSKSNKIDFHNEIKPKTKFNPLMIIICLVVVGVCLFMMSGVFNCIDYLISSLGYNASSESVFEINSIYRLFLAIFSMAIMPAIFEELIYRGVILKGLLSRFKPYVAITISSLLFALMHGSLDQTFFQLFLGFILGVVAYKTQNIIYSMLIHFLNNLVVLILTYFNSNLLIGNVQNPMYVVGSVLMFIGGIGLLLGVYYIVKRFVKIESKQKNDKSEQGDSSSSINQKVKKEGFLGIINNSSKFEKIAFFGGVGVGVLIWLVNTVSCFG